MEHQGEILERVERALFEKPIGRGDDAKSFMERATVALEKWDRMSWAARMVLWVLLTIPAGVIGIFALLREFRGGIQ